MCSLRNSVVDIAKLIADEDTCETGKAIPGMDLDPGALHFPCSKSPIKPGNVLIGRIRCV